MDKLKKHLRSILLENPAIQIKKSVTWHLPVMTYDVAFKRVKRSKMDILMKMMLLAFEQAEIRRAANLSELLLVEELFIADLLKKMQRMGLIRLEKESYKLTSKGHEQLKTGIIVEEMEEESTVLSYSQVHDEFWPEMTEPLPKTNEELLLFRYANNQNLINADRILQELAERKNELEENGFQTVVADVISFNQQKVEHVPCLEFQMYNKEQDIFYARVWNTWLKRWDDTLEQQIEEKERMEWREKWMEVDKGSE
jgi:DNA-binding IscR family transcriptional regulator